MTNIDQITRLSTLSKIALAVLATLFVKVFVSVLYEYRWYFPPDFDSSAFLSGRRYTFVGTYRAAFYTHILSGPFAILFGVLLMLTGGRPKSLKLHRFAGRLQMLIVLTVVVPSGLLMAQQAYAGPVAVYGFTSLSIATGSCAGFALYFARTHNVKRHRVWATRCFVLLASVLLLRVVSGAAIVMQLDSESFYRMNAWLSWLVPMAAYETWLRRKK